MEINNRVEEGEAISTFNHPQLIIGIKNAQSNHPSA